MKFLNNFLITISIFPIILILLVSSINLKDKSSLKVLYWKTSDLHLGIYLTAGVSIGYVYSFILMNSLSINKVSFTRKRVLTPNINENYSNYQNEENYNSRTNDYPKDYLIERDIRDPSPTISIPYKIITKPNTYSDNNESFNDSKSQKIYSPFKQHNEESDDWIMPNLEDW